MERLIFLVCLISTGYCSICPNYISSGSSTAGAAWANTFQTAAYNIAQEIVNIDEKIQKFCQYYSNYKMQQIYGPDFYQLSIVLPNFDEDSIEVKVMHRMLIVSAMNCGMNYADVKLLPDVIDARQAAWKYYEGELFIMFAYKKNPNEPIDKPCQWWIDPSKITIKQLQIGAGGNCFGFCSSNGVADGIVRDNVWHESGVSVPRNQLSYLGVGHGANGFAGNRPGRGGAVSRGSGGFSRGGGGFSRGGMGGGGHGIIPSGTFGK